MRRARETKDGSAPSGVPAVTSYGFGRSGLWLNVQHQYAVTELQAPRRLALFAVDLAATADTAAMVDMCPLRHTQPTRAHRAAEAAAE